MLEILSGKLNKKIMKYVPKSKRDAIDDAWIDSDGMWIVLKDGWNADRMDTCCHTIHEETVAELRYQIAGISKCKEPAQVSDEEEARIWENIENSLMECEKEYCNGNKW